MSKERELLERWVLQNNFAEYYALREETVTFLAQPEQKPVAWMQDDIELYVLEEKNILRGYVIPLYTAPPKREPLSDETIAKLWGESYSGTTQMVRNFARAIEKAHGITGVDDETK